MKQYFLGKKKKKVLPFNAYAASVGEWDST